MNERSRIAEKKELPPVITYTVKDSDGKEAVKTEHFHNAGYYIVSWKNPSISPADFFTKAQLLLDGIRGNEIAKPLAEYKPFIGLQVFPENGIGQWYMNMENFTPVPEMEQKSFAAAKFVTSYAEFIYMKGDEQHKRQLSVITHLNLPNELTEFVIGLSDGDINADALNKVLAKVGRASGEKRLLTLK